MTANTTHLSSRSDAPNSPAPNTPVLTLQELEAFIIKMVSDIMEMTRVATEADSKEQGLQTHIADGSAKCAQASYEDVQKKVNDFLAELEAAKHRSWWQKIGDFFSSLVGKILLAVVVILVTAALTVCTAGAAAPVAVGADAAVIGGAVATDAAVTATATVATEATVAASTAAATTAATASSAAAASTAAAGTAAAGTSISTTTLTVAAVTTLSATGALNYVFEGLNYLIDAPLKALGVSQKALDAINAAADTLAVIAICCVAPSASAEVGAEVETSEAADIGASELDSISADVDEDASAAADTTEEEAATTDSTPSAAERAENYNKFNSRIVKLNTFTSMATGAQLAGQWATVYYESPAGGGLSHDDAKEKSKEIEMWADVALALLAILGSGGLALTKGNTATEGLALSKGLSGVRIPVSMVNFAKFLMGVELAVTGLQVGNKVVEGQNDKLLGETSQAMMKAQALEDRWTAVQTIIGKLIDTFSSQQQSAMKEIDAVYKELPTLSQYLETEARMMQQA